MPMELTRSGRLLIAAAALLLLSAEAFVSDEVVVDPTPSHFSVCHGFSCARVTQVGLTDELWGSIHDIFAEPSRSPGDERYRIGLAIARFETIVGEITGTSEDVAENATRGRHWEHQLDCIDESTNSTTYLRILEHEGLLKWHRPVDRITRGWFLFGLPHTTAVIRETATGQRWTVDSWFFDNGVPPVIVPLETWRRVRWRPAGPASRPEHS
jgi:hypothetical protein